LIDKDDDIIIRGASVSVGWMGRADDYLGESSGLPLAFQQVILSYGKA
jgi:hypothetical protein